MVNDITLLKQGTKTGILRFVIKVKRFKNSIKLKKMGVFNYNKGFLLIKNICLENF